MLDLYSHISGPEPLIALQLIFHLFRLEYTLFSRVFKSILANEIKFHDQNVAQLCQCPVKICLNVFALGRCAFISNDSPSALNFLSILALSNSRSALAIRS